MRKEYIAERRLFLPSPPYIYHDINTDRTIHIATVSNRHTCGPPSLCRARQRRCNTSTVRRSHALLWANAVSPWLGRHQLLTHSCQPGQTVATHVALIGL